ncbi:glutamine synthetase family protein [Marasmitruncus massiliensis]|uniref:glutamine synthetase family protein n=1 Tax=Marasmitruncus massiliensis TaxID=1944642 RepID=UPI000C7CC6CA|nr:glutamine synthetase family protein [Marasmitruncus massiliensis]
MDYTVSEVLQYVAENDVKFIRLAFCDIFGTPKNISILSSELARAFAQGICFDASAVDGFMNVEESDLLLFPDPTTLAVLPWRPAQGRVVRLYCDIRHPDGRPFEGDCRHLLRQAVQQVSATGFECKFGAECEFYLFEMDEKGCPTNVPHDSAGYCDIAPLDKGENVRREICLTLEEMGISPETSHHEQGPGQNEIDFKFSDPLTCADNLITFKSVVRTIAARNGLFATFMPKPIADKSGSGLHINMSLYKDGRNLFVRDKEHHSSAFHSFIAGILSHISEMTLFLNSTTNSYARFGSYEAPKYITWSRENRSPLIRIPAASGDYSRMELRSPDPLCNPYLAFTLLLGAGIEGIHNKLELCPPADFNLFTADAETLSKFDVLPKDLGEAVEAAASSTFVARYLPQKTIEKMIASKRSEWLNCEYVGDRVEYEHVRYFSRL